MGHSDAALIDLNRALALDPDNSWVLTFRSKVYRDIGKYDLALTDCKHALEIQPNYALPLAQRGETYRQMGRFEDALADLTRAIELEPNDSWTIARRGETYRQTKRFKESLQDFNQALVYDPKNNWAREQRVHLYDSLEFRQGAWRAAYIDQVLEIYYEDGKRKSQYAALHLNSSYFRLVYGPDSGWGTSVILLPVFWSQNTLYQGRPVVAQPHVEGTDLVLYIEGIIGELRVVCQLRINPPEEASILTHVKVQVTGEVDLDDRPLEAFKPVMLSSMHISSKKWDAPYAYFDRRPQGIPDTGWIIQPPHTGKRFGLRGGTSEWKKNSPTIIIELDRQLKITGWVTASEDPNDDNVGLWAASEQLLTSWEYTIQAQSV
jgi:lipoprotein NlpI